MTPQGSGATYWRSLEEWADSPEFRAFAEAEFPQLAGQMAPGPTRRHFLKIMGASLALAGMTGCRRWPETKVAPYAHRPEGRVPGVPEQYATAMELGGCGVGLLVTSYDGRPIKIEGNPLHPASLGAAGSWAQASVLEMYDPDRSRFVVERAASVAKGEARTWEVFERFAREHFGKLRTAEGRGLAVLSESSSSVSLAGLRQRWAEAFPQARWFEYEPISRDNERQGTIEAWGRPLRPHLHLDKADLVVSLDADFLGTHPNALRYARDWADRRSGADAGSMNRLYVLESGYSVTGGVADHRLAVRSGQIPWLMQEVARQLGLLHSVPLKLSDREYGFVTRLVADLQQHPGRIAVLAGRVQSPQTHVLAHLLNDALGGVGTTITFTEEPDADRPTHAVAIADLAAAMRGGQVETLLILGGNPVYDAPVDVGFDRALAGVPTRLHLSLHDNETSRQCTWHLPRAHYLEAWGDCRSWDGTLSVVQPLIHPLYEGRSVIEVLAGLLGDLPAEGYEIVRQALRSVLGEAGFEKSWRRVLHAGLVADSAFPAATDLARKATGDAVLAQESGPAALTLGDRSTFEVVFRPDRGVYDGRFANNGWLQELPDAMTLLTWDNAALVSPFDARKLGLKTGDQVRLEIPEPSAERREVEAAVFVMPGQADGTITLPLGYGRAAAGRVGDGVGFNVYPLRATGALDVVEGVVMHPPRGRYAFACTQDHHAIDRAGFEERRQRIGQLIREATLDEYRQDPHFTAAGGHGGVPLQLWEAPQGFEDHKWGMAIDLNRCIGCQGCVVACQAENNIPVVGKREVARGREMHWIRVDRYFKGDLAETDPQVVHQPMTCHHCENAPCEQVCPVAATVHDTEGLNAMVYNRCVGTRYCSNNCPYKVRRFNYLDYHSVDPRGRPRPWLGMPDSQQKAEVDPVKQMVFNPQVTVRMRGVMEKCTFCVQRIQAVKITARNEGRALTDGEITPACAQSCPTQAIVFGDLNDPQSRVRKLHEHNRAYGILEELNVRPRTKYLGRVRNVGGEG